MTDAPDDDQDSDDDNSEDVLALAHEINLLCHEKAVGTILYALSTVFASVVNGSSPGDRLMQAVMFSEVAEALHAGLEAVEQPAHTLVVGDTAQVDPEQQHRATALCPMFASLMVGLGDDHDARDVLNAWTSTLIVALLQDGEAWARKVLQSLLDGLSTVETQREAHTAMDARANTDQVGRA